MRHQSHHYHLRLISCRHRDPLEEVSCSCEISLLVPEAWLSFCHLLRHDLRRIPLELASALIYQWRFHRPNNSILILKKFTYIVVLVDINNNVVVVYSRRGLRSTGASRTTNNSSLRLGAIGLVIFAQPTGIPLEALVHRAASSI